MLSWIFTVLADWNNSLWVDMLLHSDLLSWFQTNQSLLLFLNAACLAEKQKITKKTTAYHVLGEHANHYTTYVV